MKCVYADLLDLGDLYPPETPPKGYTVRAVILSATAPASLTITGADVDGLNNDDVLAAGSVIITPSKNYIAFEDGVFTEKG